MATGIDTGAGEMGAAEAVERSMAANFQAIYYRRADGDEPVLDFIEDQITTKQQPAILNQIDRLNTLNDAQPHLPFPHSSQIDGDLRELRCHYGNSHYRVLYRRSERLAVLLHMLFKTTDQVPQSDINTANTTWDDFKERMDAILESLPEPPVQTRPSGRQHIARVLTY